MRFLITWYVGLVVGIGGKGVGYAQEPQSQDGIVSAVPQN